LDAGTNRSVLLNYTLNSRSGNGFDMSLLIPTSVFAGVVDPTPDPDPSVPEPATIALIGIALLGSAIGGRRRARDEEGRLIDPPETQFENQ
jgi:hypothetical protein